MSLPGLPRLNYRVKATSNALEFWWQAPLNDGGKAITGYNLWCSSIPYSTIIGSSTFYAKASSLTNSQDYVFQLAAINTVGTGAFTNYQIAQPGIISQTGVTNLAVSTISGTTANVVWAFSNGANEATNKFFAINVYPSSTSATISSFRIAAYANQRSQLVSNLSTMKYNFVVQTINDAGWSFPNTSTSQIIAIIDITTVVPGIQLWFDGKDPLATGSAPANGSTLTSWSDKSGNNLNTTQVTGTPTFSNTLGVVFNGSSYFKLPDGALPFNDSSYSIYMVITWTNNGNQWALSGGSGGGFNGIRITGSLTVYNQTGAAANNNSFNITNNTTIIYDTIYTSGVDITSLVNGANITTVALSTARGQQNTPNYIGYNLAQAAMLGSISEILVYNVSHTLGQRQIVEGSLAWKWGLQGNLPGAHPYKNAAPF